MEFRFAANAALVGGLLLAACAPVYLTPIPSPSLNAALVANGALGVYRVGRADLNGDGRDEAIVRLEDPGGCGSGGCTAFVLTPDGPGWRVVMRATVTRLPFRVLETRSRGWADLAVQVGGGGLSAHEVRLSFDGRRYPSNPTVPPAAPTSGAPGRVVLSAASPLSGY
jgi:hypothetical protein